MADIIERIKQRAYEIWEGEGRPEGRHDEHWQQAKGEVGMMGDGTEEQNLNQPGHPEARITEEEVQEAFGSKTAE
jgi:hypothetical protein